ncbi:MAG: RQC domain-containing protein, partial [Alphaproteobacteria bacterium]
AQKVLSAVYRTGQRFGAAHVIDVLTGKKTAKVAAFGHDRLPTFGVGDGRAAAEWHSIIRQLVAAGALEQDPAGQGGLTLTGASRPLLRGEVSFPIRKEGPETARPARRQARAAMAAELSGEERTLFERLKALRTELARRNGVPAYVIFPDRTLIEMAHRRPATPGELAAVHGVGEAKLARFGEAFLRALSPGGPGGRQVPDPSGSPSAVQED